MHSRCKLPKVHGPDHMSFNGAPITMHLLDAEFAEKFRDPSIDRLTLSLPNRIESPARTAQPHQGVE
jgi:hypothetical protein